ncbi:hypothetical protein PHYPO_G00047580 [Pangasianodon hypophthalmus]|uniref:Ig-like domain-containing protein n=1 Tax=Pangasianodon hypophthalmus TaxID=310915 RepID=A0A5N5MI55_PANHP|nr:hypothetical protein PHYPO_G00047580 [Pangasianodon hypophthalmus]
MKVYCSADGDNLRFNWTSDLNTLPQLENGNSTLTLNKDHHGKVTCRVENHVSYSNNTTELHPCPESTTSTSETVTSQTSPASSLGTNSTVSQTNSSNLIVTTSTTSSVVLKLTLIILSSVCVLLIMISILAFYIYKKRQGQKNKEAPSQDDRELVYAQVTHLPTGQDRDKTQDVPSSR